MKKYLVIPGWQLLHGICRLAAITAEKSQTFLPLSQLEPESFFAGQLNKTPQSQSFFNLPVKGP
ncbi:MAG: hypothetical protein M0O96_10365 [Desulforhopalus sp.]|nr:hypothetical protein [Desulforhopalus sp.]